MMERNYWVCALATVMAVLGPGHFVRATDCNANGVQDDIEIAPIAVTYISPSITLSRTGGSGEYLINNPPIAMNPVTISIQCANISPGSLRLSLSGSDIGSSTLQPQITGCSARSTSYTVTANQFNAAHPNGVVAIKYSFTLNGTCLGTPSVQFIVSYHKAQISQDCNENNLPDECDLIPAINPLPPGDCSQAEAICPGYVYAHSNLNGSTNNNLTSCVRHQTYLNVYYKYTPSDSGPLRIAADYNVNTSHGLEPTLWLFSGCPTSYAGNLLACQSFTNQNPLHAEINYNVTGGHTYYIQVGEYADIDEWDYLLQLTGPPCLRTTPITGGPLDCNHNGKLDSCEIAAQTSNDCNHNGTPDDCEPDCNHNQVADSCDIAAGTSLDCNQNGIPDSCDLATGLSRDCNGNTIPDECDISTGVSQDCNSNRIPDSCDFANGLLTDCNANNIPDVCEQSSCRYPDQVTEHHPDYSDGSFIGPPNGISGDLYHTSVTVHYGCGRIVNGPGQDFNFYKAYSNAIFTYFLTCAVSSDGTTWYEIESSMGPGVRIPGDLLARDQDMVSYALPPELKYATYVKVMYVGPPGPGNVDLDAIGAIHGFLEGDCNGNGIPDECDQNHGALHDANHDGNMDECVADCDHNGMSDLFEITAGVEQDCNHNGIPDRCDLTAGTSLDCDANGIPDSCDIASGFSQDCNANGIPDSCELANGTAKDCNHNAIPDSCDIARNNATDCDGNGVPDTCQADCNHNNIPDVCEGSNLTIDAGPDRNICPGEAIVLGGSPTAKNGSPPYTYLWLVNGNPTDTPLLDQQQTFTNMQILTGGAMQSFVAGKSGELRSVEILLGESSGGATLKIYAGNAATELNAQIVSLAPGWNHYDLTCPVPVVTGQTYAWELSRGTINIPLSDKNSYPAGVSQYVNGTWDFAFKTFVGQLTGLCTPTEANPIARPMQSITYVLQVTDTLGCEGFSDQAVITVRPDHPCVKLIGLNVGGEQPYIVGQAVPVTAQLSFDAPAGGLTVHVKAQGFADQDIMVPGGADSATQNVTMQALGEGLHSSAEIVGMGGIISSSLYSVYPKVESVSIAQAGPYRAGSTMLLQATLREPAIAGGAIIHVSCPAFDPVDITLAQGETIGTANTLLRTYGPSFFATATGTIRATRSVSSDAFSVLPAGELFVDGSSGNDGNDGLSPASSLATINRALTLAVDGHIIHIAAGTYPEQLVVDKSLTIVGDGANTTIVDGTNTGRPLSLIGGSSKISGLTFTRGSTAAVFSGAGGAALLQASVWLDACTFRDSTASVFGGGVLVLSSGVKLTNCAIINNQSGAYGGGILSAAGGLQLVNCTIAGNVAASESGGVDMNQYASLYYCTIVNNSAAMGGGLVSGNGGKLSHCIVAGNFDSLGASDLEMFSAWESGGYNIIGALGSAIFGAETDLINVDPRLGSLGLHGGTTPTYSLRAESRAIDGGDPVACVDPLNQPLTTDQRGRARPYDGNRDGMARCDIGAFERSAPLADFDGDEDVDLDDMATFNTCATGPAIPHDGSPLCHVADFDGDNDVDQSDFSALQRCLSGPQVQADINCAD